MSVILALDTTTRPLSAALVRDGAVAGVSVGDPARTHGERLPLELLALLERHGLTLAHVDLYAVAAGPGSFTGLRIGIACIQGLALAHGRAVVAVPTLDALALAAGQILGDEVVSVWMDAQRGQVFARTYTGASRVETLTPVSEAVAETPHDAIRRWQAGDTPRPRLLLGDGAVRYRDDIERLGGGDITVAAPPPLAPLVGAIAHVRAGRAQHPAAIQPIYVRRPDAELARDHAARAAARADVPTRERS